MHYCSKVNLFVGLRRGPTVTNSATNSQFGGTSTTKPQCQRNEQGFKLSMDRCLPNILFFVCFAAPIDCSWGSLPCLHISKPSIRSRVQLGCLRLMAFDDSIIFAATSPLAPAPAMLSRWLVLVQHRYLSLSLRAHSGRTLKSLFSENVHLRCIWSHPLTRGSYFVSQLLCLSKYCWWAFASILYLSHSVVTNWCSLTYAHSSMPLTDWKTAVHTRHLQLTLGCELVVIPTVVAMQMLSFHFKRLIQPSLEFTCTSHALKG